MKNVFSKIIILLSVSFCILMPASVMADYVDADGTTVVEIVATPWVDTQQTTVQMPKSSGDSQYSSAGYIKAMAEKKAAEELGKVYQACGQKRSRIKTFTDTYQACNSDTQLAYNTSLGECPSAVQQGSTWGIKTKDGTTFGYSRTVAENAGAQCRADALSIQTSTFTNVCDKNYSAAKEAEGEMPQVCKDAGI